MSELKLLEEKFACLALLVKEQADLVNELKAENARFAEENAQLAAELTMLKNSLQNTLKEKELTRLVVDDLIKSIDTLVENQC